MTDYAKLIVLAILIAAIPAMMITGSYLDELSKNQNRQLLSIYVKRDDLVNQQQRLETLISDMNATLAYEVGRQQVLADKLAALSAEKAAQTASQNQIITSAPPQAPQIIAPTQIPVTTTRAS